MFIKHVPFFCAIFLTGDLSKGVGVASSDIDFMIITEPNRLWISRAILNLLKKTIISKLMGVRKLCCINYMITKNNIVCSDKNYFTATEIAHLKPCYNISLFVEYIKANNWIMDYLPNYSLSAFVKSENACYMIFIFHFGEEAYKVVE